MRTFISTGRRNRTPGAEAGQEKGRRRSAIPGRGNALRQRKTPVKPGDFDETSTACRPSHVRRREAAAGGQTYSGTPQKNYRGDSEVWLSGGWIRQSRVNTLGENSRPLPGAAEQITRSALCTPQFEGLECTFKPISGSRDARPQAIGVDENRNWGRNMPFAAKFFIGQQDGRQGIDDININDLVSCCYNLGGLHPGAGAVSGLRGFRRGTGFLVVS